MNSTVQFGELRDFSPTELSSAWEVDVPGDLEAVICGRVKQDVEACEDQTLQPPNSPAAPDNYSSALQSKRTFSDILRRVKVREDALQCTVARLGGGMQGLQLLMEHVNYWVLTSPDDEDVTVTISRGIANIGMPPTSPKRHPLKPSFTTNFAYDTAGSPRFDKTASPQENVDHGAAYTRALRKSHLERQRGHRRVHQRRHTTRSNCGNQPQQLRPPSANHRSPHVEMEFEPIVQNGKGYVYLFQKVLRASDVSSLGRIVLPKVFLDKCIIAYDSRGDNSRGDNQYNKDAERYFPFLVAKEGITISLEDYHSGKFWTARYRYWPNNKSRMYLLENIGDFVSFHCLQERDLLLCYRNDRGGYVIQGQKLQSVGKGPARGLIARVAQARETAPIFETEPATIATPATCQCVEGESAYGAHGTDEVNMFFDSPNCPSDETSDGGPCEDGYSRLRGGFSAEAGYPACGGQVLENNGFLASDKPLVQQDWNLDPEVAMLSVNNVKQRYTEDMLFLGD